MSVTKYFLHSPFIQCNVFLNGFIISQASQRYKYCSYLETLLTYGNNPIASNLTNAYWYLITGDMHACDTTAEILTATTNVGFITV